MWQTSPLPTVPYKNFLLGPFNFHERAPQRQPIWSKTADYTVSWSELNQPDQQFIFFYKFHYYTTDFAEQKRSFISVQTLESRFSSFNNLYCHCLSTKVTWYFFEALAMFVHYFSMWITLLFNCDAWNSTYLKSELNIYSVELASSYPSQLEA